MMLLDSNLAIYAAQPAYDVVRKLIAAEQPAVSDITRVESLGYHRITDAEKRSLERLFHALAVLLVTVAVCDEAIHLRQQRKMSLGDALIAGTALVHRLTLATHNTSDFAWIPGLTLFDPLAARVN